MKKFLAVLLLAVLLFSFAGEALACTEDAKAAKLYVMVNSANAMINQYVRTAQSTPWDDVDWLLFMVDQTVNPVFAYADSIGATVQCSYVERVVDGRTVLIDPLYVVNVGGSGSGGGKGGKK